MLFFLYLIFGKIKVRIHSLYPERLITAILKGGVNAKRIRKTDERTVEFVIPRSDRERLRAALRTTGNEMETVRNFGLPAFLSKYKKRYGLLVGIALFFAVVFLSTQFLWRIEITGNERTSREEILETLRENGVYEGVAVSSIDIEEAQHRCVLSDERLAWVSLNRVGTVMQVELREALTYADEDTSPANLVASCDAQIDSIEVHDGIAVVNIGDSVRAGELLISGVVDGTMGGLRNLRAGGKVLGRVSEHIRVEIPFEGEEKVYTGAEIQKKTLVFFGKTINLFLNSGISMQKYDTMISRKNMLLRDGTALPVGVISTIYREYEMRPVVYSPLEAYELAREELIRRVSAAIGDAELLARSQSAYFTEDAYVIDCELYLLKDIAKILPLG